MNKAKKILTLIRYQFCWCDNCKIDLEQQINDIINETED